MKDTPRTAASKLTKAQAKALFDLNVNGPDAWARNFGRAGGTMIRLFGRMKEAGFVEGPPYKVTEYGELVLDELRARSASKSLGEN